MGLDISPYPGWFAILQAMIVGLCIPMLSSIIPIQRVLDKTIVDSMSKTRGKTGLDVEISEKGQLDRTPYLVTGILSVTYGIMVFVFLPQALVDMDLGKMLTIFFLLLLGMIFGLSLLTTNV